jgi:Tol biopolymer transport system component
LRRLLFLATVLVLGASGAAAWGAGGTGNVRLAYAGVTPTPPGIYRVDPGKKAVRVSNVRNDSFPAWSADGKAIAFVRQLKPGSSNTNCRIMIASGGKAKPIAHVTAACRSFSWFRTGWIAFNDPTNAVWIVKPDGSGLRKLMAASDGSTLNPACSPNGKLIAFGNGVSGGIYVAKADGSDLHAITKPALGTGDGYPSWSPNGKQIAFTRLNTDFTTSVMVASSDGKGAKKVASTMTEAASVRPAWTADGKSIVYGDVTGISIVSASGGKSRTLVPGQELIQPAVAPK